MLMLSDWIRHLTRRPLPRDPLARRRFLQQAAWTTAGLAMAPGLIAPASAQAPPRARFVAEPFSPVLLLLML